MILNKVHVKWVTFFKKSNISPTYQKYYVDASRKINTIVVAEVKVGN